MRVPFMLLHLQDETSLSAGQTGRTVLYCSSETQQLHDFWLAQMQLATLVMLAKVKPVLVLSQE